MPETSAILSVYDKVARDDVDLKISNHAETQFRPRRQHNTTTYVLKT